MNQEQFEGSWEHLKGDLKKQWGKLTEEDLLQVEAIRTNSTLPSISGTVR